MKGTQIAWYALAVLAGLGSGILLAAALISTASAQDPTDCPACVCPPPPPCPVLEPPAPNDAVQKALDAIKAAEQAVKPTVKQ